MAHDRRRPARCIVRRSIVVGGVVFVGAELVLLLLSVLARRWGTRPPGGVPGVAHFRRVDSHVWAGGQPTSAAYRSLAERGVRVVVDLRAGSADDPRLDDPDELRRLGIDHVALPTPDGHVPSAADSECFVAVARRADGILFVHCGAGVGRSSTMSAAYLAATGVRPRFWDHLAIGPHSLAQVWFVAMGRRGRLVRRLSELFDAPRRARSRLRAKGF